MCFVDKGYLKKPHFCRFLDKWLNNTDFNEWIFSLIKAEIYDTNNFSYNCIDFKEFIKNYNNCIKAAKSNQKYTF